MLRLEPLPGDQPLTELVVHLVGAQRVVADASGNPRTEALASCVQAGALPPPPFRDTSTYDLPAELPHCGCGGRIRPHICWFGEVPFELDRILGALDECTVFMAVGTSGVVEPAASFVAHVRGRARTIYLEPEEPANASAFTECHLGTGEVLPDLLRGFWTS